MGSFQCVEKIEFQKKMLQHPKLAALSVSVQLISGEKCLLTSYSDTFIDKML
jgi:hypothetical protein